MKTKNTSTLILCLTGFFINVVCALAYAAGQEELLVYANNIVGIVIIIIGFSVFLVTSDTHFRAISIFSLACAFFVGLGSITSDTSDALLSSYSLLWTSIFFSSGFYCTVVSYIIFRDRGSRLGSSRMRQPLSCDFSHAFSNVKAIAGLCIASFLCVFIIFFLRGESHAAHDLGIFPMWFGIYNVLLLLSLYFLRSIFKREAVYLFCCALFTLLYLYSTFTGYGRIQVAVLMFGCINVIFLSNKKYFNCRPIAFFVVTLSLPFLWLASIIGQSRGRGHVDVVNFFEIIATGQGLGSVFSLLHEFTRLLEHNNLFFPQAAYPLGFGSTYLSAIVWFIPRHIWPDKPLGFGAELAYLLAPEYAISGHTTLVTSFGEMFYNFGWAGVIILSFFVGAIIYRIDSLYMTLEQRNVMTNGHVFYSVLYSLMASGMLNFVWGGTATFLNREGTSLLALFVIASVYKFIGFLINLRYKMLYYK